MVSCYYTERNSHAKPFRIKVKDVLIRVKGPKICKLLEEIMIFSAHIPGLPFKIQNSYGLSLLIYFHNRLNAWEPNIAPYIKSKSIIGKEELPILKAPRQSSGLQRRNK